MSSKRGSSPLPEGWELRTMASSGRIQAGRQRSPHFTKGANRRYLRVANVYDGYVDLSDVLEMPFTDTEYEIYRLKYSDVLLNEGQSLELVGRPAMYKGMPAECCFQNTLVRFRAHNNTHPEFALALFQHYLYSGRFSSIASQTTSVAHLGVSRFANLTAHFPPLEEQRKIADILSAWDEAIEQGTRLLKLKRERKRGLMRQLLTGKVRFKEFEGLEWHLRRFGDVFKRVTRKNSVGNTNALTISGTLGLISQTEFFNKRVASEDVGGYYLLNRGEFAYNKSYSNGYPMGAMKRLDRYDQGVLSTLYICFAAASPTADSNFFAHYFESGLFNREISLIAQEGARNHGLLNVSTVDFFKTSIPLPPLLEQRKIAAVLILR